MMPKHAGGRPRRTHVTEKSRAIRRTADDDARLARLQALTGKTVSDLYRDGLQVLEAGFREVTITPLEARALYTQRQHLLLQAAARAVLNDLQAMGIETASSHALRKLVEEKTP
jgi:hypothetical protein